MRTGIAHRARTHKLRGTLVSVDLVNHTIVIQPSEHDGKRARRLKVMPDSKIFAGGEPLTLADVIVGDWVQVHFVNEEDQAVLKSLHVPRGMVSNHPAQHDVAEPTSSTANKASRKERS